ncbi:MAG: pyrroline-5-carboxylate reductase [Thermostichales cyanobacterium BF3_bins_165]
MTATPSQLRLGVIGGGAMATALLQGILSQGSLAAAEVGVSEPDAQKRKFLADHLGVNVFAENGAVLGARYLLLAIKPQVFPQVQGELAPLVSGLEPKPVLISIMAGIPIARLQGAFPGWGVVRTMPKTPALVGAGITAVSCNSLVTETQRAEVMDWLRGVGEVVAVPEALLDGVTAVSGSGPGYVALLMEAMMDGAVQVGLPREVARQLVLATFRGTAELCAAQFASPALLKDQVTSPGGTTIAGLAELEKGAVRGALMAAIRAAYERARVLGQ